MGSGVFYIIFGVLGLAVVWVIIYFIIRFLRGSLKLQLSSTAINPGEKLTGHCDLTAKKEIEGYRLFASLIGTRVTKTNRNGSTQSHSTVIYRNEAQMEGNKTYPAGFNQRYEFSLDAPQQGGSGFMNSDLANNLGNAVGFLTGNRSRLSWKVEVRLDCKGVDLAASKKITVNM